MVSQGLLRPLLAGVLLSAASSCSAGKVERCRPQQSSLDGRCVPDCASDQERIEGQCVARCVPPEIRLGGECLGPRPIRVDSVGYVPGLPKIAVVVGEPSVRAFEVHRAADADDAGAVFSGDLTGPIENADTGEVVYHADFSDLEVPGSYSVIVRGFGESTRFRIAEDTFNEPLRVAMLGYYGLRCGSEVHFNHLGDAFGHKACHLEDAFASLASQEHIASTGGWHDAGDYGKYGVNSGFTLGMLLLAWQQFQPSLESLQVVELPEHGGPLPDYLAEVRYQLDWMLTTQAPSGAVYHKLTAADFNGFTLPESDSARRAFAPVSAEATASFAAAVAMAAVVYRAYDPDFADQCLSQAKLAMAWLNDNPTYPEVDLTGFTTGQYKTDSADDRFWAKAALWSATEDAHLLSEVEAQLDDFMSAPNWDWSNVENLGLFIYLRTASGGRDADKLAQVQARVLDTADGLVASAQSHGYGRAYSERYYWGSNGILARTVLNLGVAFELSSDVKYRNAAVRQLDHLFGVNVFGRSQVTGIGYLPPQHPHHRPSGGDRVDSPWPGLLVGGPNGQKTTENAAYDLSVPARAWQDVQAAYWSNEVAINWNAPLVYGLAWFSAPDANPKQ
jgi:endoglucanase